MTACRSQWRGGWARIPPLLPGQASPGSPIHLSYVRVTPKDTVSACEVTVPQGHPGDRGNMGWQGTGNPLTCPSLFEIQEANDGHRQLFGCFGQTQGVWGKGKEKIASGRDPEWKRMGCPSASKDRWQRWTELIPAGENWLWASEEHSHWPPRWKRREIAGNNNDSNNNNNNNRKLTKIMITMYDSTKLCYPTGLEDKVPSQGCLTHCTLLIT